MSEYHYGEGSEVRDLGRKLKSSIGEVKTLTEQAGNYLKKMQESVRDDAYKEAEEIVVNVQKSLLNGLEDAYAVVQSLNKYADYLDEL